MSWSLLQKYLAGECTSEEELEVEDWIEQDQENAALFHFIEEIWQVEPRNEIQVDAQTAWEEFNKRGGQIEQRRQDRTLSKVTSSSHSKNRHAWSSFLTAAAVVTVGIVMYFFLPKSSSLEETVVEQPVTEQQISTELGQRTSMRLADGSRVYLNAGSSITVPSSFGDSIRQVYLSGEAFFEVEGNPQKPFIVRSDQIETRVLGTKFNVSAYPCDPESNSCESEVEVVVEEGQVELAPADKSGSRILPYHLGILSESGAAKVQEVSDLSTYIGWKEGRLVFDSTPFAEVVPRLERWYDISIRLENTMLATRQLTASFSNEPMTEVLNVIALSLDMNYTREGRNVMFSSK